ncbi:MAG: hypothetical protein C0483_07210 [Pirellula sp.]|nr:hypothetical protein [Pirellula sp.]
MKVSRFLLTWAACGGLLAAAFHFAQPNAWFTPPTAAAVVEVRVVPRFAPTAATVRQAILSETYLNSAWHRFHNTGTTVAEPTDAETPEAASARQAQLEHWRARLDATIEPHFVDNQRQIRITCAAGDDVASAGELVQFLATRYAGELSAARWYDAVDRLRVTQQQYKTSGDELLAIVRQAAATNKSAALTMPSVDSNTVRQVAAAGNELGAPRLIGPSNEAALEIDTAPKAIVPTPLRQIPLVAQSIVERAQAAGAETARLTQVERRFLTAGGAMERELAELLAPQSAEFPVVATEIVGLHFGHTPGFWYVVAALSGLLIAALAEFLLSKKAGGYGLPLNANPLSSLSRHVPPPVGNSTVELPAAPAVIHSPEDAARAVRAPLIGVVRRRVG